MTRFLIALRCSFLVGVLTIPAVAQTRQGSPNPYPMPETLTLRNATLPTWIAASRATTAEGKLDPAVWGAEPARIREILGTPSDHPVYRNGEIVGYQDRSSAASCRPVGATYFEYPDAPRRGTLDEAIADSRVALLGRITNKAYGFYAGDPGQLFEIEPIRSFGHSLTKARYYFFIPVGRFHFGGIDICKSDDRYAGPPDIGGEVFLFVGAPADRAGVLLHVLDPGDIVPVDSEGLLRLPRQYAAGEQGDAKRSSAMRSKSELLARLEAVRASGAQ